MKAFPSIEPIYKDNVGIKESSDMDLRDYFAAKAMLIAIRLYEEQSTEIPYIDENNEPMDYEEGSVGTWFPQTKEFGKICYVIADAMLEARND
jgi:hypothetical protein